jgi:hypothetical protein
MPLAIEYFPFPDEKNPADKIQLAADNNNVLGMLILRCFPESVLSGKEISAGGVAGGLQNIPRNTGNRPPQYLLVYTKG